MVSPGSRAVSFACLLLVATAAHAQEASTPQPAAAPQARSSGCSGFWCMFSSHGHAQQAPAQPQPVALAPAAGSSAAAVADDTAPSEKHTRVVHAAAKAERPLTIAVASTELDRVKKLATALPRTRVHFVSPAAARRADLVVKVSSGTDDGSRQIRLFSERMYVVAGGSVHSLADLRNKVVSFGPAGDAAGIAARKAFSALDIPVTDTSLDYDNALDGLATGDIAAVIVLAPEPARQLKDIRAPGLHLVSWPDGATPPSGTTVSAVETKEYPHLATAGQVVRTMDVDTVLDVNKDAGRKPAVRRFLAALEQHSAELSKAGFDRLGFANHDHGDRQVASVERR